MTLRGCQLGVLSKKHAIRLGTEKSSLEQLLDAINEVLVEAGRQPVATVGRHTLLSKDLGMDSLELAVLTVKLEAATGVDVFARGIVSTVGEIEDRLRGE